MNLKIKLIRVDPFNEMISMMIVRVPKNALPVFRRLLRAKTVNSRKVEGFDESKFGPLIIVGGMDTPKTQPVWRLNNVSEYERIQTTAGIGILIGKGPLAGGMVDCPVSLEWARSQIIFLPPEA